MNDSSLGQLQGGPRSPSAVSAELTSLAEDER